MVVIAVILSVYRGPPGGGELNGVIRPGVAGPHATARPSTSTGGFARAVDELSGRLYGDDAAVPLREVIAYMVDAGWIDKVPGPGELVEVIAGRDVGAAE